MKQATGNKKIRHHAASHCCQDSQQLSVNDALHGGFNHIRTVPLGEALVEVEVVVNQVGGAILYG